MKTVLCVFGTRPEAIKMAPVVRALRERSEEFRTRVVVTGQHRELLEQVLDFFGIVPDADLAVMSEGQTLTEVVLRVMSALDGVLHDPAPDLVLVHGDTATTMAAAQTAFFRQIPVGHVEAGLRSFDIRNPYPEEFNRRVADAVSALHFAPTERARRNLLAEGLDPAGIFVTGNTGIDALHLGCRRLDEGGRGSSGALGRLPSDAPLILVTAHRRENFGPPLAGALRAMRALALERPGVHLVYPVHPNPEVQEPAHRILGGLPNVHLLEPQGYADFLALLRRCRFVVTDSGGLQEEAPALGKPVLVLREVTERPEAVEAGTARVVGTDPDRVGAAMRTLLDDPAAYSAMANAVNPYGDGRAAERTLDAIRFHFGLRRHPPEDFTAAFATPTRGA